MIAMPKSAGSFQKGHPFYGDLSKPNYFQKGQVAHNKGIPTSEEQKQKISLSRDTPERRSEIEEVKQLYWGEELTPEEISIQLDLPAHRIHYLMRRYVHWRGHSNAMKLRAKNHPETVPRGANSHSWKGGISYEPYPFEFNWELKQQIKERDNYTCQECGLTEAESIANDTQALPVHHIDYDKQNLSCNNLITLCMHCNGIANFNREYWEEHFREKICALSVSVEKVPITL